MTAQVLIIVSEGEVTSILDLFWLLHHIQDKDTQHIRPLSVAQSRGSQAFQTDCEVNTGAGCNILPANKAQQLFGHE